ncbi:helix-turn-helix domain-containing protein [Ornithinimicrobium sp. F0845]|uniref:helix-turn-helix transcriptional regulator n=1 Tax=Ornithinimicrobium sp. F0845 TaxID=2926412 RepID=UPI001FF3FF23|nr:helix-turn-helix domain-containing protein [Ornithinimicrobium sp. F0845]MCK0113177.1 helix-turn-helix domain-containing protein [Ornithinimicrobium sp. F0845]
MDKSTRLGPAPWRPSGETDQSPAERVLAALAEQVRPITTADLVGVLGLHANTVRAHLQDLVGAGLVAMETVPPVGRGRPAHRYRITDEGRAAPRVSDPTFTEYRGLTTAFATYLASRSADPSEESRQIGRAWGAQLAAAQPRTTASPQTDSPSSGPSSQDAASIDLVVRLLARLGFTPVSPEQTEAVADEGIALRTCPLLELAEEMPHVICQVHQGLVEGALDQYGSGSTEVELRAFSEPGACRLHLRDGQGTGRS